MSQPIYFLPGASKEQLVGDNLYENKLNRALLTERGLAGVFADVTDRECVAFEIHGGHDGKAGCFLYYKTVAGRDPLPAQYVPAQQTWTKASDKLYIGLSKDSPPTAEDLRRRKQFHGYAIEMGGQQWSIPIIRRHDDSTNLPRDCYLCGAELVEPVKESYRSYWDETKEVSDWFFADNWAQYTKYRGLVLSVKALGLNYRYEMLEHSALRIIDSDSLLMVLMATVDVPGARDLEQGQKKTPSPSDEANTTPGPPED